MPTDQTSCELGDHLAIWIVGIIGLYVGEIIEKKPLRVKVAEVGILSSINDKGFNIRKEETTILQKDIREGTWIFADRYLAAISALEIFGSSDGEFISISRQIMCKLHKTGKGRI